MAVEIVWRDLRTGEILSRPRRGEATPAAPLLPAPGQLPGPGNVPQPIGGSASDRPVEPPVSGGTPPPPPPVLVQSVAGFIPELGESITTAYQRNINRLAVRIVEMMEKPW
jgi:hypothetical protein